jgi:hypothetical protein
MKLLLDAFWRAAAYCVHPKVIGLSMLPLLIGGALAFGLSWIFWEPAVAGVRALLENWSLVDAALKVVESFFNASFRTVLAPIVVVAVSAPVILVLSVLLVALLMVPAIVSLVATRRFPGLARKRGAGAVVSALWSLGCTVVALVVLALSLPLWLIPPVVLVLPPLIWGWLTYQLMSFDTLAEHASADERRTLMRAHRLPLMVIGVACGYMGSVPSIIWVVSPAALIFAPVLFVVSVWLYTLVFAFSALWFAHYLLAALARLRGELAAADAAADAATRREPSSNVIDITAIEAGPP